MSMKLMRGFFVPGMLLFSCLWASCGGGTIGGAPDVTTCTTNDDCEANEICINGECRPEGGDYGPIACTDDGDCPSGWVCVGGFCEQVDGGQPDGDGMPEPDIVSVSAGGLGMRLLL
jgi:hypothetical protein